MLFPWVVYLFHSLTRIEILRTFRISIFYEKKKKYNTERNKLTVLFDHAVCVGRAPAVKFNKSLL